MPNLPAACVEKVRVRDGSMVWVERRGVINVRAVLGEGK